MPCRSMFMFREIYRVQILSPLFLLYVGGRVWLWDIREFLVVLFFLKPHQELANENSGTIENISPLRGLCKFHGIILFENLAFKPCLAQKISEQELVR